MNNQERINKATVLLTGGTGLFGRFLAAELFTRGVNLVMLVRAESSEEAVVRAKKLFGDESKKIKIVSADLAKNRLGVSEQEYSDIAGQATHILHAAASIRFNLPLLEARRANVETTENVIAFARSCPHLRRFGFVSTALVSGNRSGVIKEDEFEHGAGFKNTYEETKYEAEKLVRGHARMLPVVIFRPPLIIAPPPPADRRRATLFLKLAKKLVLRGYLPFIPGTARSTIDVVDSNDAARVICDLFLKKHLSYMAYHITNGNRAPTVADICDILEEEAGRPITFEFVGDMETFNRRVRSIPWYRFAMREAYRRSETFLSEAAYPKTFDNSRTLSELGIVHVGKNPLEILRKALQD